MSRTVVGLLAFVAGAVVGGVFVRQYVKENAIAVLGQGVADQLFGAGSKGATITGEITQVLNDAVK